MRVLYKTLSIVFIILFIVAMAKVAYDLYTLEEDIAQALGILDINQKAKVTPVAVNISVFVGIGFSMGLLAVMFQILGSRYFVKGNKAKVVYVERNEDGTTREVEVDEESENVAEKEVRKVKDLIESHAFNTKKVLNETLSHICSHIQAAQGAIYVATSKHGLQFIELEAGYAYHTPDSQKVMYEFGEGLAGQVAKDGKTVLINSIPEGYMTVVSGLGNTSPRYLIIAPIRREEKETLGVIEVASFEKIKENHKLYIEKVADLLAAHLATHPINVEE